jgi:tetratricopeptide (TPR) repeat protein
VEQTARQWLARQEPAAALLGASYLLTGSSQATALAKLRELAGSTDRRVAQMAAAQTWRTALAPADETQIDAWAAAIEQMPESLAAGPYFVLGRARAQRQQWPQAALALLRVAILYPGQRALAAQSLLDAGRVLERLDQPREAALLYREVIRDYAEETRTAAEAQSRIEALGSKKES